MSGQETLLPSNLELMVEFENDYAAIPPHMQEALRRYIVQGIRPGQFLSAVLSNNLERAVGHADAENLPLLKLYVQWLYNVAPSTCWGSMAAMEAWIAKRVNAAAATS